MGKSTELGMHVRSPKTRIMLIGIRGSTSLLDHDLDALNVNASRTNLLLMNTVKCSNHEFLLEQLKNYPVGKSLTRKLWRDPTTWKDMLKKIQTGKQKK